MKLTQNKFLELIFSEEQALLEAIWLESTREMTKEEYKEAFLHYFRVVLECKPGRIFVDERLMDFPVTPELQEWINQNIHFQMHNAGIEAIAIVMSIDMIAQMAVEQLVDDSGLEEHMEVKFFDNEAAAREWLLNN